MQPHLVPRSVEELLEQSSWLCRLATTLVAGEDAAEDLVQETWLAALRHPPRSEGPSRPWLARIARNLASNFRRGEARRREHEGGLRPRDPGLDPGAVAGEVEAQRILAEALLRLEESLRSVVVLRYSRGLDSRAIGRLQGVPAGTVRWRLKRALELLRIDLDRRFGGRRWCPALAVLLPGGKATSSTAGPALTSAPAKIGATAALATGSLAVLFGAWWIAIGEEARPVASVTTVASSGQDTEITLAADAAELELVQPASAGDAGGQAGSFRVSPLPANQASAGRSRRGAPIRGQLRIDRSEDVLDQVLTLRLRTGDMSVKETVQSAPDGSFRTKRPFPRGFVLAEVLRPAGDPATDYEGFFDPSSDDEWIVSVPWPNFVRGRLVDRVGRPLEGVEVRLLQGGTERERDRGGLKGDGVFSVTGLNLGQCTVTVRRGFERHEFSTAVTRGPNELGDVVVPFRERVGPIRGRLRSGLGRVDSTLDLTHLASGVSYQASVWDSEGSAEFEFEQVPVGDCRLTLRASDGLRYAAPTRLVRPPATGIEFVAIGKNEPLTFRALDGELELVSEAHVLVSGRWCGLDVSCQPAEVERWVLVAEDHRPASGTGLEATRVDVRLEPGWGCALFFREGSGGNYAEEKGPVAGVEIRADGVLVARSDQDGLALVSLPRRPGKLECGLDGWVMEDDDGWATNEDEPEHLPGQAQRLLLLARALSDSVYQERDGDTTLRIPLSSTLVLKRE